MLEKTCKCGNKRKVKAQGSGRIKHCIPCATKKQREMSRNSYKKYVKARRIKERERVEKGGQLCTCCERRAIAPGNRFLCYVCFVSGAQDDYYKVAMRRG